MNPTYWYEIVAIADWNDQSWQATRIATRVELQLWYVGTSPNDATSLKVFYFTLPAGAVTATPPQNPPPRPLT